MANIFQSLPPTRRAQLLDEDEAIHRRAVEAERSVANATQQRAQEMHEHLGQHARRQCDADDPRDGK